MSDNTEITTEESYKTQISMLKSLCESMQNEIKRLAQRQGCAISLISSRMCEKGTKGCDIKHQMVKLPSHIVCDDAPEYIWLQTDPEGDTAPTWEGVEGVTWCQDKINSNDTLYVRADLSNSIQK